MTPYLVEKLLREALSDTGTNVVKRFLAWARGAELPYRDLLPQFDVPLLAVAGGSDLVIPPKNVKYVVDRVSSADKTYLEMAGFGHEDLCAGDRAPAELFPLIRDWIAARASLR